MRRLLAAGLAAVFALSLAVGCGSGDKKTVIPEKQMEVPKEGPVPVGGAPKGKGGQPGEQSSSQ